MQSDQPDVTRRPILSLKIGDRVPMPPKPKLVVKPAHVESAHLNKGRPKGLFQNQGRV